MKSFIRGCKSALTFQPKPCLNHGRFMGHVDKTITLLTEEDDRRALDLDWDNLSRDLRQVLDKRPGIGDNRPL